MKWSPEEPFGLRFFVVFGFGWLVGLGWFFVYLSCFFGQWSVWEINTQFCISVGLLVGVTAPVQVRVGAGVCEADEPWPHTHVPGSNGHFLSSRGCTCVPPAQHTLLGGELCCPALLCCCLSSAMCFHKCLLCYTTRVQALPVKLTGYLPAHSKSTDAGVKFTEGLWTLKMCLRGLNGTCEWVESRVGNKVLGRPIQLMQLFPCSREHLLLLFLQSFSSVDHSC